MIAARVLAEALAANDARDEAGVVAAEAIRLAYSTEQVSERVSADALLARLEPRNVDPAVSADVTGAADRLA